jgi:hypothetical protein
MILTIFVSDLFPPGGISSSVTDLASAAGYFSTESLILAQDERWRRA